MERLFLLAFPKVGALPMHPSAERLKRPNVLARWNHDLCNTQGPSHSKHASSPQTNACFSTTHGFNWRVAATIAATIATAAAVSATEKTKKKKTKKKKTAGDSQQTRLGNQRLADKLSWQRPFILSGLPEEDDYMLFFTCAREGLHVNSPFTSCSLLKK